MSAAAASVRARRRSWRMLFFARARDCKGLADAGHESTDPGARARHTRRRLRPAAGHRRLVLPGVDALHHRGRHVDGDRPAAARPRRPGAAPGSADRHLPLSRAARDPGHVAGLVPDLTDMGRRGLGRAIGAAIIVATVLVTLWVLELNRRSPRTDDAYVRANIVGIAPHGSGAIVELPVVDNQALKAGDPLFVVDPRPYQVALDRARADLAVVESQIQAQQSAIAAAEAEVKRREAESWYASDYLRRVEPLLQKQYVTTDKVEDARSKQRAAAAAHDQAPHE